MLLVQIAKRNRTCFRSVSKFQTIILLSSAKVSNLLCSLLYTRQFTLSLNGMVIVKMYIKIKVPLFIKYTALKLTSNRWSLLAPFPGQDW